MTSCLSWSLLKRLCFTLGNNIKSFLLPTEHVWETLVGVWPCVPTLLCVDNIVLSGWLTERTWRHEIIQCQVLCSPDRNTEGVTMVWNLSLVLQAVLPVLSDMYNLSIPSHLAFLRTLVTPLALLSKTSQSLSSSFCFVFSKVWVH